MSNDNTNNPSFSSSFSFFNVITKYKREFAVCLQYLDITETLIRCYKEGIVQINNYGDIVIMCPAMFYNYYFEFRYKLSGVFLDAVLTRRNVLIYGSTIDLDYIWLTAQERYHKPITKNAKRFAIYELLKKQVLIRADINKYKVYKLNFNNKKIEELINFVINNPCFVVE